MLAPCVAVEVWANVQKGKSRAIAKNSRTKLRSFMVSSSPSRAGVEGCPAARFEKRAQPDEDSVGLLAWRTALESGACGAAFPARQRIVAIRCAGQWRVPRKF